MAQFTPEEVVLMRKHVRQATLCVSGMYIWEILVSLWFEFGLISRRLSFKWPLVPYFLARYAALAALVALAVNFVSTSSESFKPLSCNALLRSSFIFGYVAMTFSSFNLMIRAIIIWSYQWFIVTLLAVVAVGQSVMFVIDFLSRLNSVFRSIGGKWDPHACISNTIRIELVGGFAIYNAGFDLLILVASLVGLRRGHQQTSFISALRAQGVVYFFVVAGIQSTIAIFSFTLTNNRAAEFSTLAGLVTMAIIPAVACRMVRCTIAHPNSDSKRPTAMDPDFQITTTLEMSRSYVSESDFGYNKQLEP